MRETKLNTQARSLAVATLSFFFALTGTYAQSGGPFEITDSVVGSGGDASSAGIFEVDATLGQVAAGGPIGQNPFSITSGFWNYTALAPTAAHVSIAGRVVNAEGFAVQQASLRLMTQEGEIMYTRTSTLGYYRFDGVMIGQSVFINVSHKHYVFEPRSFMVSDEIAGLDFVAVP